MERSQGLGMAATGSASGFRWRPRREFTGCGRRMMVSTKPTIVDVDMERLDDVLRRAEAALDEEDYALLKAIVESYHYVADLVGDKNTSIARLRKLLFGARTEKTSSVLGKTPADENAPAPPPKADGQSGKAVAGETPDGVGSTACDSEASEKTKGHGRNGADAYTAAEKIEVPHATLSPGDPCPECPNGTVYDMRRPGVVVRLVGQAPVGATVYYLQKLRCGLCGVVFTADLPADAGEAKYDATVGSMIALLKYGTGVPFHREETLQASLGVPLPASTQWDVVRAQAERAEPVFHELVRQAAQGDVVYNDDTTVRILALMGERGRHAATTEAATAESAEPAIENAAGDAADDSAEALAEGPATKPASERRGLFTSGVVSTREGRRIALFFSGRKHAGENLRDVLARRAAELAPPIQMCDALSRNMPAELVTIVANCLAHGRRQFVDEVHRFPEECRHVLEALSVVYHNDAVARKRAFSPQARLEFHQAESGPTMEDLRIWLVQQLDQRRVEPNSALGGAMTYLLKRWEKLTLFLRVPGAPLDNNICERALKKSIRHRRNSLFYKTPRGARVGDVFMSLIHTCELGGVNPFDYLTELDRHADQLGAAPQNWMPWNYRETLERIGDGQATSEESRQEERRGFQAAQGAVEAQEG
jgi:transposase